MRVLIVDDSAFMRKMLRAAIENEPGVEVVGTGRNGDEALELARSLKPDLITLDVEMPGTDGLTALRRIMREAPTRVVIISSTTPKGSQAALTALRLGAIEVIAKSAGGAKTGGSTDTGTHLRRLIQGLRSAPDLQAAPTATPHISSRALNSVEPPARTRLIAIGSSTGGPPVLEKLMMSVPETLSVPIVIAQHMPLVFTKSMAERFDAVCKRPVHHLEDRDFLKPGNVYICPGGLNTHIEFITETLRARVNDKPAGTTYFPSVDVLFDTASEAVDGHVFAMILTGMGDDGAAGATKLVERGGTIVAQRDTTCVVYGMPKAVVDAGIASGIGAPEELASLIGRVATTIRAQAA